MRKFKYLKRGLAILLIALILVSTLKFLIFKPKIAFADSTLGFNEGYGTTINDNNGNISGTITNAVWKNEDLCKISKCLYFDGTGDYVSFADDTDLDFIAADNFTLEGWFRTPDITSGQRTIIAKHNATASGYKVYIDSSGYLVFGIDDDSTWTPDDSVSTTTTAFDDNKWHFFSVVKTDTTSITIYVDGIQYQTDSSMAATGTLANADTFYIGIDGNGSSNAYSGFIDEIKVYRSARTTTEIKSDYLGETPSRGVSASFGPDQSYLSNGLAGYWKLDESSGNASDYSGNSLTLTNNATTTYSVGKFGNGSEHVPASSQYLSTATTIAEVKSVSFWTNPDSTTNYFVSLTSGAYVTASGGTLSATGFTNPKIYVNGIETSTIIADSWQLVTITTETSIGADQFYVGRQGSNYYDGTLDEIRIYNRSLSPAEVFQFYNFAPGPVGYWKFDESSWTNNCSTDTVFDSSGNGYHGDACPNSTGPLGGASGKYGNAGLFDDTDDYVGASGNAQWDSMENVTISMWIKANTHPSTRFVFSKALSTSDRWGFRWTNTNYLQLYDDIDNAGYASCQVNLSINTWYYVTGTISSNGDGTYTNQLYVNGVSQNCSHNSTGSWNSYAGSLYLGSAGSSNTTLNGNIDDVRIYNYVRTPTQIIEDMNGGHPAGGSPVGSHVGYWKFDEGYGTTANDNSINANNLTLSTASWTNLGKYSKAWNGTGALWVSRANDADIDFSATESFTLSGWFKSDSATNPTNGTEYFLSTSTGNTDVGYQVYAKTDGTVCFAIDDDGTWTDVESCTATDYYDGTWHHFTAVRNVVSDTTKIYIDAYEKDSDTDPTTGTLDGNNVFYIGDFDGDNNVTAGIEEFAGDIDEVKVFRSALTSDNIKVLYNQNSGSEMGALSTNSSNTPSWSANDEYCPPGQGSTCTPPFAHYDFDTGSGTPTTLYDKSGNQYNGTVAGSMLVSDWVTGKYGSALRFDGSNDLVDIYSSGFNTSFDETQGTISIWLQFTAEELAETGTDHAAIQLAADLSNYVRVIKSSTANEITINYVGAGTVDGYDYTTTRTDWFNITIAWDKPNDSFKTYIDGILINSSTGLGTWSGALASTRAVIGARLTSANDPFKGKIDDVRIYNYARTPAQVAWDYNHGGPVGWWKLDENTGTTANDSMGNSTAGTLTNTPTWVTGKFNYGVSFAGSNQQILTAVDPDFDFGDDEDITLTTWFKHGTASAQEIILSKYAAAGYKIIMEADGDITCGLDYDSTWSPTDSATSNLATYDDNIWHHIVCVKTGATSLALYIDGVLISTDSSITATNTLTNADPLYFGIDADGTSNDFTGSLDDVRIYRYPLTSQQIKTVMNNGSAVKY